MSSESSLPDAGSVPTDTGRRPIKRALISVYDKTSVIELGRGLAAAGVQIVSTGTTAAVLTEAGVPVTKVEDLTGFPECFDGRVKTLHPKVHAGLLADTRKPEHVRQLAEIGVEPFDLLVSNLYPFRETASAGGAADSVIEQIDIGGPSMVRGAAKNHPSVAVVVSPAGYVEVLDAVRDGGFTLERRKSLAVDAFVHTASYDIAVASWLGNAYAPTDDGSGFPAWLGASWHRGEVLRYGENPHQRAALYRADHGPLGPRAGSRSAWQGDVVQQLRRHRCSPTGGIRLHRAVRRHHQARQPVRHCIGRRHCRGASQGTRVRSGVGIWRRDRHQSARDIGVGPTDRRGFHRSGLRARVRSRGAGFAQYKEKPAPDRVRGAASGASNRRDPADQRRRADAERRQHRCGRRRLGELGSAGRQCSGPGHVERPRFCVAGGAGGEVERDRGGGRPRDGGCRHGPGQPGRRGSTGRAARRRSSCGSRCRLRCVLPVR